ncbi:MAG: hypothetical protein ALECFALPRED_008628 [Alectoria fallacina]|uniref:type I protein arginine methyltransferase n=1 Tax=Alectoria fallacina TaxID=1903189 RepID=A0A8H3I300_9LECA|nr:MAG: hypothetical protein ALECFALPRED_008628 [Alectoria fallacina]
MVAITEADQEGEPSDSSEEADILDLKDDEGWEDQEPDVENIEVYCLGCSQTFSDAQSMLPHCRDTHNIDIVKVQKTLRLDFLEMIKMINFIRAEGRAVGRCPPDLSSTDVFQSEHWLIPQLEDDALLYSLHDIIGEDLEDEVSGVTVGVGQSEAAQPPQYTYDLSRVPRPDDSIYGIAELEQRVRSAQRDLENQKQLLASDLQLHGRLENGLTREKTILEAGNSPQEIQTFDTETGSSGNASVMKGDTDSSYFASYSGHDIHETMLKDTVRTDAYRDFIYENKDLFKNKTVLDVGCGTGILSMFCARAGAKKVIAVDNSDIINFARENVYRNGMGETIVCLRGKIEEVVLPLKTVDIIVSEWMGYCLLYEAMLDSVLWARDHYLAHWGLMVPSHCTLRIAPMADSEYVDDHIHHWKNVYGFDMSSMCRDIYRDVVIREVQDFAVPAESSPFLQLCLRTTKKEELVFASRAFSCTLKADMGALDGFVIWFDTFFEQSPHFRDPAKGKAEEYVRQGGQSIAFTTGPYGKRTHWQQGCLLIDHKGKPQETLKKGQVISGSIGYEKREDDNRALDIKVQWEVDDSQGKLKGKQSWSMR